MHPYSHFPDSASRDFDRGCLVYDVGKLFNRMEPANPTSEAWKAVVQTVLEAWGLAEAAAIHPDHLNRVTSCSKKCLKKLQRWTYVRATKRYPPEGDVQGRPATEEDLLWASKPFQDF